MTGSLDTLRPDIADDAFERHAATHDYAAARAHFGITDEVQPPHPPIQAERTLGTITEPGLATEAPLPSIEQKPRQLTLVDEDGQITGGPDSPVTDWQAVARRIGAQISEKALARRTSTEGSHAAALLRGRAEGSNTAWRHDPRHRKI